MLDNLEVGNLEYKIAEYFLVDLKKKFSGRDKKAVKIVELKRLEQENKTMEEFVQEFRRVARESGFQGWLLVEEFKYSINGTIQQKLIELEC